MFVRLGALLLLAACAWAGVWHTNFVVDQLLLSVGVDTIPLPDILIDVEHSDAFSELVDFHLVNGTLRHLRRRVRRIKDCNVHLHTNTSSPHAFVTCKLALKNLVVKYGVEVITDDKSEWMVTEGLLDDGKINFLVESYMGECSRCTRFFGFSLSDLSVKLKPQRASLDLPHGIMEKFEKEVVSRAPIEIARALNTTYKQALGEKMSTLKPIQFIG